MSSLTAPVTLLSAVTATGASKAVQVDAGMPAIPPCIQALQLLLLLSKVVLMEQPLQYCWNCIDC
jgi:hypothetical protein